MDILVLGGTVFLSRAMAELSVARGHNVTTFNRGVSGLPIQSAQMLTGDRDNGGDLGWFARGMITRLAIEKDVFSLEPGKVSGQKSDSSQTVWYKVLEKDPSRALDDDQKKKISDQAYSYFYQQQKAAHVIQKLVPGHELDS